MYNSFEEWRRHTMASYNDGAIRHYHRVEDYVYLTSTKFLLELVKRRVETGRKHVHITMSDDLCNSLLQFCDEMQLAYIHPRSSSHRAIYCAKSHLLNS